MDVDTLNLILIQQGAEAKVYRSKFLGRSCIIKERFSKKYRLPEIDKSLTQKRITHEIRSLVRCRRQGILCPSIYFVDFEHNVIIMEDITESVTLKETIFNLQKQQKSCTSGNEYHPKSYEIVEEVGSILSTMHNGDIIHGDLTTSNMLIQTRLKEDDSIYLIDFGLSSSSSMPEEKGVDLYVLERAFTSTHPNSEDLFSSLLDSYFENVHNSRAIKEKFEEIRLRGRKRSMLG